MSKPKPTPAQLQQLRWEQAQDEWANGVLFNAPESWDGDDAAESIALDYVAELEARLDRAGISRERYWSE